jgi:hypothetical protein
MTVISLDPGVQGTGVAIWSAENWNRRVPPIHVQNFDRLGTDGDWKGAANRMGKLLDGLMKEYGTVALHSEFPQLMSGAGGHMVAASGDLQKLTFIVGVFAQVAWANGAMFTEHLVHSWKGQMSKEAVIVRIKRKIPKVVELNPQTHSWDAIGIGLHAQGFFNER